MSQAHGVDVEAYLKGEMVLHFRRITLTQRRTDTPIVFSGPGQVHLHEGRLNYVIYHTGVADEANRLMMLSTAGKAGELVHENALFDFEGVDVAGKTWAAEGVDTSGGSYRFEYCVVQGSIEVLSSRQALSGTRAPYLHQIYFDDPHFPSPRTFPSPGLEFVCADSSVTITKDESGCDVSVFGGNLNDRFSRAIVKTLSVLSGVRLQLGVTEKIWGGQSIVELYSRDIELSNRQLLPPVKIPVRCPSDFVASIFTLLVGFFEHDGAVYYDNWNKLNRAWQTGLEPMALNVSVCIEGVLKAYFEELGTDRDFAELAKLAVPEVTKLNVDKRIKTLLSSCLGGTCNFKPKTALRALKEAGDISPDLAAKWNKLRSETAHAVVGGEAREDWQRTVNLTFANIKLFYEILFLIVGYEGERIDYESHGFPSGLRLEQTLGGNSGE